LIKRLLALLGLIITQFLIGKKGAFPYGVLVGFSPYSIAAIVVGTDLLLMFLVDHFLHLAGNHVFPFTYIHQRTERLQQKLRRLRVSNKMARLGSLSVMIITATPFAGGVWTGMSLARVLGLARRSTFLLVGVGSIIGAGIFLAATLGVISLF